MGEIAEHCWDDNQKAEYIASVFDYLKESNIIGVVFLNKDIEYQRQYTFSDNELQLQTFIEKAKEPPFRMTPLCWRYLFSQARRPAKDRGQIRA